MLCRSESNRRELARLREQGYGDLADSVKRALAAREQIVAETADLQSRVRDEFRKQRTAKATLIRRGYGPRTPEVRDLDRQFASVYWLVAVTVPIPDGQDKGRLRVPIQLVGPYASEALIALKLSGARMSSLVPL